MLDTVTTWDDVASWLRERREEAGRPTYAVLASRVTRARRARGLPGNEARVGRSTVYDCFALGRRRMDVELLADLCRALGVPDEELPALRRQWTQVGRRRDAAAVVSTEADPSPVPWFTGRRQLLAELAELDGPVLITGMAGVGKTQVALRLGADLVHEAGFAGVLVADLRGFHPSQPPADPQAMVLEISRELGGPASVSLDQAPEVLAELTARQGCLLVLDDVASVEQASPLIPASGRCVLTSRLDLELPGVALVPVTPFDDDEAQALFAAQVGTDRVQHESAEARRLSALVGHLPLAVDAVAARVRARPDWSLADHQIALERARDLLRAPEAVTSALAMSWTGLSGPAAHTLRLLADQPCRSLAPDAIGAMLHGRADPGEALSELRRAHLVQGRDRLQLHALVRQDAAARAVTDEPPSVVAGARRRLCEHLISRAWSAVASLGLAPVAAARHPSPTPDVDAGEAQDWLAAERENLLTLSDPEAGASPGDSIDLSLALSRVWEAQGLNHEAELLHRRAAAAAHAVADAPAEGRALVFLAQILCRLGETAEGITTARRGLDLLDPDDGDTRTTAWNLLAILAYQDGRPHDALAGFQACVDEAASGRTQRGSSALLGNMAVIYLHLGDVEAAAHHHRLSWEQALEEGDRHQALVAKSNLVEVLLSQSRHHDALALARECLADSLELAGPQMTCLAHNNLAQALSSVGDHEAALAQHEQAVAVVGPTGDRITQASLLTNHADTARRAGLFDLAADLAGQARTLAVEADNVFEHARAVESLGLTARAESAPETVRNHLLAALALFEQVDADEAARVRAVLAE